MQDNGSRFLNKIKSCFYLVIICIFTIKLYAVRNHNFTIHKQHQFSEKLHDAFNKAAQESPLVYDESLIEKPIVILVPSYNNAAWYKENLDSICMQNYSNYRVVYVDDCSPDQTGELVKQYITERNLEYRITLLRNKERKLAMANIYNAIANHCEDREIVVMLDGDDFLAQSDVLKYINHVYSKNNIWLTYGSNLFLSTNTSIGWAAPFPANVVKKNGFRSFRHGLTHMRTFYAWLFKKIDKSDLMYQGKFLKMTSDVAMYMPMIEMAGERHLFIDKILYLYNDLNQISDYRVNGGLQWRLRNYIRSKKRYQRLAKAAF